MQYRFKNTFPLDGKIKLAVGELSENRRKKNGFSSRNKVIFQNLDFPLSTRRIKSLNKRIPFGLNRKSVSIIGDRELV